MPKITPRQIADMRRDVVAGKIDQQGRKIREAATRIIELGPKDKALEAYRNGKIVEFITSHLDREGGYIYTPVVVEMWIRTENPDFKMPPIPKSPKEIREEEEEER